MIIAVATDKDFSPSDDRKCADTFIAKCNAAGHTASYVGRGPNTIQAYARSHSCDIMVQIAAGKCIGTLADFVSGIHSGNYKAKKFSIPYWKNEESVMTWPARRSSDDNFSWKMDLSNYLGKTLPTIYEEHKDVAIFSHGNTAEEMAAMFLKNLGGGGATANTGNTGTGGGGGNTGFDLIKQVITPWDKYGVALELNGDTLHVYRATTKGAPILTEDVIVNDSISITDYGSQTVNYITDGKNVLKNDFLVKRFGKIEAEEKPKNKGKVWLQDMFQVAQRDSRHTIDLKVLFDPKLKEGMYVRLQLKSFDIDGYYFVSKTSVEEESCMSITLDPAPPSRYQEVTESVDTSSTNTGNGLGKDMISIGNALASKYKFANSRLHDPGEYYKGCESYSCMKQKGNGSCWAWSEALYVELNAVGIKTRIIQYPWPPYTSRHRSVQVYQNGKWVDYPYGSTNISKNAKAWSGRSSMFVYKDAP